MKFDLEEIESCEPIGEFTEEYVYDVEVDDDTHTFIANDILVHNSLFVSFQPAIVNSTWQNLFFDNLHKIKKKFIILKGREEINTDNENCLGIFKYTKERKDTIAIYLPEIDFLVVDGYYIKNRDFEDFIKEFNLEDKLKFNWSCELDYIQGIDYYRYAGYFKKCLEDYAETFGVENLQDFELERISESVISIAKKKYIQHIVFEDGITYDRLKYIYPKGIELIRRSTPLFAREKIIEIINYIFSHPDTFNIKDLVILVKKLKKEFDLCVPDKIDDISMQSSCSNYETYVLEDKKKLAFANKTPASVKAAAYYNYILSKNKDLQTKYEYLKSGSKIKYYYCKDKTMNKIFAFIRGSFPIEFGPEIDLQTQFSKCILSPINSIITPLGLPVITDRLSVVLDIFGDTLKKKEPDVDDEPEIEDEEVDKMIWEN